MRNLHVIIQAAFIENYRGLFSPFSSKSGSLICFRLVPCYLSVTEISHTSSSF